MNLRKKINCLRVVIIALMFIICSNSLAAEREKTEVLPADGGELGKGFVELNNAFKTANKGLAAKLLDPDAWHLDNKATSWFALISERLSRFSPTGGRRQGNRATLFLFDKERYYAMLNATYIGGIWQFDSPSPSGSSFDPSGRDCKILPTRFPCAANSAPDAKVSGAVQSYRVDPETKAPFRPVAVFDGMAIRMMGPKTKALKSIMIVLSGTGINPQMVALSNDPEHVRGWLNYPVLVLDVAADGKSAKAQYYDGISPQSFDVTNSLSIDLKTAGRISGRLKADQKSVAKFDISFDIGALSDCLYGEYRCGD